MKKIPIIIGIFAVFVLGLLGGYFYSNSNISPVLPNGDYDVTASWNWKKLSVYGDTYTLDDSRKYELLAQNTENGIIVINTLSGVNKKTTQTYKIVKSGDKYEWHAVSNGKISDNIAATATKK